MPLITRATFDGGEISNLADDISLLRKYVLSLATALQRMHLQRIVHRDLKPSNILCLVCCDVTRAMVND